MQSLLPPITRRAHNGVGNTRCLSRPITHRAYTGLGGICATIPGKLDLTGGDPELELTWNRNTALKICISGRKIRRGPLSGHAHGGMYEHYSNKVVTTVLLSGTILLCATLSFNGGADLIAWSWEVREVFALPAPHAGRDF